ncbi:ankyrin repeat protein [Gregarina niphandrodes]|uniref:Ankyrin repeat protein n=1 Tax=Gregarina niphandrodes TaxID=110365 RepID=A0A023BCR3_GRENI|nr:ankyrin repeat protein [Gregarina niphandrodes]EZG83640.1 ankyrin repeat protein [Gregarina niphandrodes]|eukprot:XP_011128920.1 ankyrin repeat protein [Gregarina niphandrodes]
MVTRLDDVWPLIRFWALLKFRPEWYLGLAASVERYEEVWEYLERNPVNWESLATELIRLKRLDVMESFLGHCRYGPCVLDGLLGSGCSLLIRLINDADLRTLECILRCAKTYYDGDFMSKFSYVVLRTVSRGLTDVWNLFYEAGFHPITADDDYLSPLAVACRTQQWPLVSVMLRQQHAIMCNLGKVLLPDRDLPATECPPVVGERTITGRELQLEDKTWHSVLSSGRYDLWSQMVRVGLRPPGLMRWNGDSGKSWLMMAVESCDASAVRFVLGHYPLELHWVNSDGENVSHYAVRSYPRISLDVLELLLDSLVDFGQPDNQNRTGLFKIMDGGYPSVSAPPTPRESGPSTPSTCTPSTSLPSAAAKARRCVDGHSTCDCDSRHDCHHRALIKKVIQVSSVHVPSFFKACIFHPREVIQTFLDRGYPVLYTDAEGYSCLWHSARHGRYEITRLLLETAKAEIFAGKQDCSAQGRNNNESSNETPECNNRLAEILTAKTVSGKSALAACANETILQLLLEYAAPRETASSEGN